MRYVVIPERPKANWFDPEPMLVGKTVHEPEAPVDTGVLDPNGRKIYRVPGPVGFVELKERT